jgi:hypothetical protein
LPAAGKSRRKTKHFAGKTLAVAYNLVPGMESLPRVFRSAGEIKEPNFKKDQRISGLFGLIFFGSIIAT